MPFNHDVTVVVMKNCDPCVSGPAFAMATNPTLSNLMLKFSSSNVLP
jgi:hypothetical protein